MDEWTALVDATDLADRVAVMPGYPFDPRHRKNNGDMLAMARGRDAIEALLIALETKEGERMNRMMPGNPCLTFLDGNAVLANVLCLNHDYVRCEELWSGDAPLRDPSALRSWLTLRVAAS